MRISSLLWLSGFVMAGIQLSAAAAPNAGASQADPNYPPEKVISANRKFCENRRTSASYPQYRCDCVAGRAQQELKSGRLTPKSIAQKNFSITECIDRPLTAQRYLASLSATPMFDQQIKKAGGDPDALRRCYRHAIENLIPLASLENSGLFRSELKRHCRASGR